MENVPDGSGGSYGHNVYVTKIGSAYPNTFIEFGGHLDSQPGTPGGNDNASGSIAVIELARVLKDYPNRYSMRFAVWTSEELGRVLLVPCTMCSRRSLAVKKSRLD